MSSVALGAVTLDGASSKSFTQTTTMAVTTESFTTGSADNRLMMVGVSWNASASGSPYATISSVTFNGTALTHVGTADAGNSRAAAIYYLVNPPANTTGTVTVTFSKNFTTGIVVGVANFSGVDQTTPLDLAAKQQATGTSSATSVTVGVTTLGGDELVFDTVFGGGATAPTLTPGEGQSALWNVGSTNPSSGAAAGGGSTKAATSAGGTVTMSWSRASGGYMALVAVPINPASTDPNIMVTGALNVFRSLPGTYSAVQSYKVSGSNLTADITVAAPVDFEISTTSDSGFGSSLTLPQSGLRVLR
jgi:hypothetical protein